MALFHRFKEIKSNNLLNHFKRYYFQIHTRFAANHTSPITVSGYYQCHHHLVNAARNQAIIQRRDHFFTSRVRYFAAPVQVVKKKEEVKALKRPRLNDEITVDFIRLIKDDGHSIVSRGEAMKRAKELNLDLVEVDRTSKPPVCRIMDYHREQYNKQVKKKEKAKIKSAGSLKTGACKEVRFSLKAELKDLKIKADAVKRLMERGYRVKCMALATSEDEQALSVLLSRICELVEDVAFVELGPKIEKKQGYIMVRHVKFGPSKKGAGKKASKVKSDLQSGIQREGSSCSDSNADLGEQTYAGESGMDDDDDDEESDFDVSEDVKGTNISHDKGRNSGAAPTFSPSQAPNLAPPSQRLENRYARKVPNNASAVRNPTRFPNGSQPQPGSRVYPPGGFSQNGNNGPPPRNFPHHPHPRSEIPDGARQSGSNFTPRVGPPRPPSFTGSQSSHSAGLGISSGANASPSGKPDNNFTHVGPPRSPSSGGGRVSPGFGNFSGANANPSGTPDSNSKPQGGPSRSPSSSGSRGSQSPGFGIFSGAEANPSGKFESGGDANQQFNGNRSNVPRNGSVPGNMNPSTSTPDGSTPGGDKKWGIFSGES